MGDAPIRIIFDSYLSEEGGRFYHEENRNVIIEMDDYSSLDVSNLKEYLWCDFTSLNYLTQVNNCLNIQLRNLISLLPM